MGVLDSIKGMFGGGSERSRPPENRLRQPPGRDNPPGGPEAGPGPEPGRESGGLKRSGGAERGDRGSAPNEGPGRSGNPEPPRRETPASEGPNPRREDRSSTLDVDRESSNPPTPGQDPSKNLDFEPSGGSRASTDRSGNPSSPAPPSDRREEKSRGPDRRDETPGPDMPDRPGDYNTDLPEPRESEDRIDKIKKQNQRIIDLLEDIRDRMGTEGGRR